MRQGGVMKIADAEAFGNELRTRRKVSWSSKIVTLGDIFSSVIPNAA